MPENLTDVFTLAAMVLVGDFFIFGMTGMEAQLGHGSVWNPEPIVR